MLFCKVDKPFIVVEVETTVVKYLKEIDSIAAYFENTRDYNRIGFDLLVMLNNINGAGKYKHNWHDAKEYAISKDIPIAFVSIEKSKADLGDTGFGSIKEKK